MGRRLVRRAPRPKGPRRGRERVMSDVDGMSIYEHVSPTLSQKDVRISELEDEVGVLNKMLEIIIHDPIAEEERSAYFGDEKDYWADLRARAEEGGGADVGYWKTQTDILAGELAALKALITEIIPFIGYGAHVPGLVKRAEDAVDYASAKEGGE